MLISYKRGQTSVVLRVKILDSSVSTGAGKTGLTFSSSGLIISATADNEQGPAAGSGVGFGVAYTAAGPTIQSITTLGTYAAPSANNCRFREVDATNHKGVYELQFADARFAVSSAKSMLVSIAGATNMAETDFVVPLQDVDPYDVVRGGMTAFPAVVTGNAGAVLTAGTGTGQLSVTSGLVTLAAVTHTGAVIPTVTTTTTTTNLTNAPTAGDFTSTMKTSIGTAVAASSVASVTAAVQLDKTQVLSAARDVSAVADTSLTLNDVFHCAIAGTAGKETIVGTTYTIKTPSTGTTLRIFTLDSSSTPTSRT